MIQTFFSWMDRLLNWALALLMATMLVVIAAQVFYRFCLNDPLDWSEEMGRYLFVWLSFLGAAAGVRQGVHLGVDILEKLFSKKIHYVFVLLVNLLIQIFLIVITVNGFKILKVVRFQTSASMGISMVYPYLAVPVGCIFMFINSARISGGLLTALLGRTPPES